MVFIRRNIFNSLNGDFQKEYIANIIENSEYWVLESYEQKYIVDAIFKLIKDSEKIIEKYGYKGYRDMSYPANKLREIVHAIGMLYVYDETDADTDDEDSLIYVFSVLTNGVNKESNYESKIHS